jgi:two-component system cell cycle sensor histidine kinase/response regulator CckA
MINQHSFKEKNYLWITIVIFLVLVVYRLSRAIEPFETYLSTKLDINFTIWIENLLFFWLLLLLWVAYKEWRNISIREKEVDKALRNISPDVYIYADKDMFIKRCSQTVESMIGYKPEDLLERPVRSVLILEEEIIEDKSWIQHFDASLKYHSGYVTSKDGKDIPVLIITNQLEYSLGTIVMLRNITDINEAKNALKHSENKYQILIESAPVGIMSIDTNLKIIDMNAKLHEIFDLPDDRYQGAFLEDIEELQDEEIIDNFHKCMSSRKQYKMDKWTRVINDEQVYLELHWAPITSVNREVLGVQCIFIDITERTQLEERFYQAQKMEAVGRLAGGIAHDFNNLLTVISGYSAVIISRCQKTGDDEILSFIREIDTASNMAASLTQKLLAFSRRHKVLQQNLDINLSILELDKIIRHLIGENIELVVLPEKNVPTIKMDPSQLEQILINLVINAKDAMPNGGSITISTAEANFKTTEEAIYNTIIPGKYVKITISDTGEGMSEEIQRQIFEPFFSTKDVGKGTGLGLATVYGIVSQSNGYIMVDSVVKKGTSFHIYLPAIAEKVDMTLEEDGEITLPGGDETILLVEDETSVQVFVETILKELGYTVLKASNGEEGLRVAKQNDYKIDMLLTDVVMPKLSGHEMVAEIRNIIPDLRVLYMSGYVNSTAVPKDIENENTDFLQKPFTALMLATKIRLVLEAQES